MRFTRESIHNLLVSIASVPRSFQAIIASFGRLPKWMLAACAAIVLVTGGCAQPVGPTEEEAEQLVHDAIDGGRINTNDDVSVSPDGVVFVKYTQLPGLLAVEDIVFRCFGGGFKGGWQGRGCFTGVPIFDDNGMLLGMAQALVQDGTTRMACARPIAGDEADDPNWCRHAVGIDTEAENKWIVPIDEYDSKTDTWVTKHNICVGMLGGRSSEAKAECISLHVEP